MGGNNGGNNGAEVLANMPAFEEHMKSFAEAKSAGEVPDGVRDEQDYQEYIAEKGARNAELAKDRAQILKNIETMENVYDKNLAISFLPLFLGKNLGDDKKDVSEEQRYGVLNGIISHIQNGNEGTLKDYLRSCENEAFKSGDYQMSRLFYDCGEEAEILELGNKIDKEEDATDDFDLNYDNKGYYFAKDYFQKNHETRKIAIAWAKEIAMADNEKITPIEKEKNHFILESLSENACNGNAEHLFDRDLNRCIERLERDVDEAINTSDDPRQAKISLYNSEILGIIWAKEIKDEMESRGEDYESYKKFLQKGKELISSEVQ